MTRSFLTLVRLSRGAPSRTHSVCAMEHRVNAPRDRVQLRAPTVTSAPDVYAHRFGGHYGPECSRAALERSLAGQVDGLEVDVVLTRDEEIVACHDPLLDISTADLSGWAHQRSAAALTQAHLLDNEGR